MIRPSTVAVFLLPIMGASQVLAKSSCAEDADCIPYEACIEKELYECPSGGPPPCFEEESDEDCVAHTSAWKTENCTSVDEAHCSPRWLQTCESAPDCGQGFACENGECFAMHAACEADADCPDYWQCLSANSGGSENRCAPPAITGTGGTTHEAAEPDESEAKDSPKPSSANGCTVTTGSPIFSGRLSFLGLAVALALVRRKLRRQLAARKLSTRVSETDSA